MEAESSTTTLKEESKSKWMYYIGDDAVRIEPNLTEEEEKEKVNKMVALIELEEKAMANLEAMENKLEAMIENKNKRADGFIVHDVVTALALYEVKFLISGSRPSDDDEVPISDLELEGKVVGLYYYSHLTDPFVFRELGYMYETLRRKGENFELVFIPNFRDYNESLNYEIRLITKREILFQKKFLKFFKCSKLPWLAVRFRDKEFNRNMHLWSRSLRDTREEPPELVIVRPGENIAHAYAMDIFREFGIDAYPFSKSRLTELVVARLKSLTLQHLCMLPGSSLFNLAKFEIYRQSEMGNKILLFLYPRHDERVNKKLGEWYKEKDDEFFMIGCCYKEDEGCRVSFPWTVLPNCKNWCHQLSDIFKYTGMKVKMDQGIPMFLAFGRDGKFITMTSPEKSIYDDEDCQTSPDFFDDVHLYGQVSLNIAIEKKWRALHEDCGKVHQLHEDCGKVHQLHEDCS